MSVKPRVFARNVALGWIGGVAVGGLCTYEPHVGDPATAEQVWALLTLWTLLYFAAILIGIGLAGLRRERRDCSRILEEMQRRDPPDRTRPGAGLP